jgi:hypothetical protein
MPHPFGGAGRERFSSLDNYSGNYRPVPSQPQPAEEYVQLATRLPQSLFRRVKVWCVQHETTMQDFITDALREKRGPTSSPKRKR